MGLTEVRMWNYRMLLYLATLENICKWIIVWRSVSNVVLPWVVFCSGEQWVGRLHLLYRSVKENLKRAKVKEWAIEYHSVSRRLNILVVGERGKIGTVHLQIGYILNFLSSNFISSQRLELFTLSSHMNCFWWHVWKIKKHCWFAMKTNKKRKNRKKNVLKKMNI